MPIAIGATTAEKLEETTRVVDMLIRFFFLPFSLLAVFAVCPHSYYIH